MKSPPSPALRANPFPEVTDLFCRLPLSTLFYRPEAAHLGDLMRLWVRPCVKINLSHVFSRAVKSAPETTKCILLYQQASPISRQTDSRAIAAVKKKRELFPGLPPTSACSFVLPQKYRLHGTGILTCFPFDRRGARPPFNTELPYLLGPTNPRPTAVHVEPFSTSAFKVLI